MQAAVRIALLAILFLLPCSVFAQSNQASEKDVPSDTHSVRMVYFNADPPLCATYAISGASYPTNTYCTRADSSTLEEHRLTQFTRSLLGTKLGHIQLFFYGMDNPRYASVICQLVSFGATSVQVAIQADRSPLGVREIERCAQSATVPFSSRALGRNADFSSFHVKIAAFERDDTTIILTGSGNPMLNSEAFHDYAIAFEVNSASAFSRWHACIGLVFSLKPEDLTFSRASELYQQCDIWRRSSAGIQPFLLPFDRDAFVSEWRSLASASVQIEIIVQHANSTIIRDALLDSLRRGNHVKIIMDDDIVWAKRARPTGAETEYYNTPEEYDRWLEPLMQAGAEVRFLPTNHHTLPHNFLHIKLANFLMPDGSRVSIFGAPNMTRAALYRNLENAYSTALASITTKFSDSFSMYWERLSIDQSAMPKEDFPPTRINP
ncbi:MULTISPECIES: phospholipase D-like domain-containing protein [unclassified Bradyrhizobium]|uniref:phospholipase D-like domain-containing protein n=1 Tax=unclassified Bradyrhizobium TaxID=2631580 RepID=UPI001CD26568|nr:MULTISPECIES: phospholipase D-like domain-containing protein [unclassified Bradyrhizobium]MCA1377009.1 phospholipase D family protein [Bradyrhizobium sp. IC4060]MCA1484117.1 phospholipase D family protein [Bradyrhizobium sp. IC4061]